MRAPAHPQREGIHNSTTLSMGPILRCQRSRLLTFNMAWHHGTSPVPMRMVSGLDDAVDWWCQSCAYAERPRSFAHVPAMYVVYLGAQHGCPRVGSVAIGINIT